MTFGDRFMVASQPGARVGRGNLRPGALACGQETWIECVSRARAMKDLCLKNRCLLDPADDDVIYGAGSIDAGLAWQGFRLLPA